MAFLPYQREVEGEGPRTSTANAYPYAAERILSLFADPTRSPDLASSTPRPPPTDGGHHGEHGSLDVVQSRAPLVLAGASPGAGTSTTTPTSSTSARPWPPWPASRDDLRDAAGEPDWECSTCTSIPP